MVLDTDMASYQAVQTLVAGSNPLGLKIKKIALYSNSTSVAGTVSITDPITTNPLMAPMVVSAGQAAGTVLYFDEFTNVLRWQDFKVTGLTATSTKLMIWFGW
jgi:hypothetical protein